MTVVVPNKFSAKPPHSICLVQHWTSHLRLKA